MKRQLFIFPILILVLMLVIIGSQAQEASPAHAEAGSSSVTLYATSDTYIYEGNPSSNYGMSNRLIVGRAEGNDFRILVRFDLSSIPVGSTITSATLELYRLVNQASSASVEGAYYVWPYRLRSSWGEKSVTWNSQPSSASMGDPATNVQGSSGWTGWSVTNIVSYWVTDGNTNYGFMLRGDGSTIGSFTGYSRETSYVPRLSVRYTEPTATPTKTPRPTRTPTALSLIHI